jgi:methionine-rich copper-binding protein CopC
MSRWPSLVAASALVLLMAAPALAHAALVSSDPADGATVTTPYVLNAVYDEDLKVDGSSITVRDAAGDIVAEGGVLDDPLHMIVNLPALAAGDYSVHWVAITADDNGKTQGDFAFTVAAATPAPTPTPSPTAAPSPAPGTASPGSGPTQTAAPPATASPIATSAPTPSPAPAQPGSGSSSSTDLLVPLLVAVVVVAALGWFYLRRRA